MGRGGGGGKGMFNTSLKGLQGLEGAYGELNGKEHGHDI